MDRRSFVRVAALSGIGISLAPQLSFGSSFSSKKARIGFIGVGGRGRSHLRNILNRKDVIVPAFCDIDPIANEKAQELIVKAGYAKATVYDKNEHSFEQMLERDDLDGVIISTPWLWHTKMAAATMKAGKYAGVEVSAANTLQECWDLVNAYEETGVP
ncbi:MAG: Gfo/Idh/MocA family oxidoreductase, partial [Bacteroidales bacterium]|nr:Gfo/Idh/MocA family oxidoreductase [Bacteroidales bacterium]